MRRTDTMAEDTARAGPNVTSLSTMHDSYVSAVEAHPEEDALRKGAAEAHARELRRNLPKMEP